MSAIETLSNTLPEQTVEAYKHMLQKHPKLEAVKLRTHKDNRPAYYHHGVVGTTNPPYVSINEDWRGIAEIGLTRPEIQPLRDIIKENLGVDVLSPEFLFTFILMHEYAHAYWYWEMTEDEKTTLDQTLDQSFVLEWGASTLKEFKEGNPNVTQEQLMNFTQAYRRRTKEKRADSIACELLQDLARNNSTLFPEIKNLTKNYD